MSRDEAKSKLGGLGVEVWLTRPDWSALCAKQSGYLPGDASVRSGATSKMNPAQTHQIMDGFGSALTGSSADLIAQLAPPTRDALLRELFPAGIGGIGMSCLRISIGASDLSSATLRKSAPAAALLVAPGAHRRGCARRRVQQGPRSHMADIMTRGIARFQSAELDVCQ